MSDDKKSKGSIELTQLELDKLAEKKKQNDASFFHPSSNTADTAEKKPRVSLATSETAPNIDQLQKLNKCLTSLQENYPAGKDYNIHYAAQIIQEQVTHIHNNGSERDKEKLYAVADNLAEAIENKNSDEIIKLSSKLPSNKRLIYGLMVLSTLFMFGAYLALGVATGGLSTLLTTICLAGVIVPAFASYVTSLTDLPARAEGLAVMIAAPSHKKN